MRKGDVRNMRIDGVKVPMAYLGKGHFTRAFRSAETVFCFTVEEEYMKDCIAEQIPNPGPHIPAIRSHASIILGGGVFYKVYSMPFYPDLKPIHGEAYRIYRKLLKVVDNVYADKYSYTRKPLRFHGHEYNQDIIDMSTGMIPASVTKDLQTLKDAATLYGASITMEFGIRNLGVNKDGGIVFRDCLFDAEKLYQFYVKGNA